MEKKSQNELSLLLFLMKITFISVYNTCTILLTEEKYNVDANLDASDNIISGNEPLSEMLTSQSKLEMCQTTQIPPKKVKNKKHQIKIYTHPKEQSSQVSELSNG